MDILTSYYNDAGQIVSRSADLSSREFYRDYMAVHRFNEMFTASSEDEFPSCSIVKDNMLYRYGYGGGIKVPGYYDSGNISIVEVDGKRFARCSDSSPSNYITIGSTTEENEDAWTDKVLVINGDTEFGINIKSPSEIPTEPSQYLEFSLKFLNTTDNTKTYGSCHVTEGETVIKSYSLSFLFTPLGGSEIVSYIQENSIDFVAQEWPYLMVDPLFMSDGGVHSLSVRVRGSGDSVVCVDGIELVSLANEFSLLGFCRPEIAIQLHGGDGDSHKFLAESAWVKII